jgi:chromosome segregation ATPase
MKILKNSTYEGLLNEIEFGKKQIQELKQQIKFEIGERGKAIEQKKDADKVIERLEKENNDIRQERGFYEKEMNKAKEDFSRVFSEKEKIKNELEKLRKIFDAQELAKDDANGDKQSKTPKARPAKKSKTTKE